MIYKKEIITEFKTDEIPFYFFTTTKYIIFGVFTFTIGVKTVNK